MELLAPVRVFCFMSVNKQILFLYCMQCSIFNSEGKPTNALQMNGLTCQLMQETGSLTVIKHQFDGFFIWYYWENLMFRTHVEILLTMDDSCRCMWSILFCCLGDFHLLGNWTSFACGTAILGISCKFHIILLLCGPNTQSPVLYQNFMA